MGLGNMARNIFNAIRPSCVTWQSVQIKDKKIIFSVYFRAEQSREIKKRILQKYESSIKDFQANFNYSLARICILAITNERKLQKSIGAVKEIRITMSLDRTIPMQYSRDFLKNGILLLFFDLNYILGILNRYQRFKDKNSLGEFGARFKEVLSAAFGPKKIESMPLRNHDFAGNANQIDTPIIIMLSYFIFSCWESGLKMFNKCEGKAIEIDCGHFLSFREGFSKLNFDAKEKPDNKEFLQKIDLKMNKSAEEDAGKIGLVICAMNCLSYLYYDGKISDVFLYINNKQFDISEINQLFSERQTFSISPIPTGIHSWIYRSVKQRGFEELFKSYHEACDTLEIDDKNRIIPKEISLKIDAMRGNL